MHCPRDNRPMLHETFSGVGVELCPACGGTWFDAHELSKFDDAVESAGEALIARVEALRQGAPAVDTSARMASPVEPDVVMMRRFADPEGTIEIDECPATGGLWLDAGELAALRHRFPDTTSRDEATRVVIERVMACPDFQAARQAEQADLAPRGRIAGILGWLRPRNAA